MANPYYKRSSSRNKSLSRVVLNPTLNIPQKNDTARIVRIRLVFIRIGEIDTLTEKYQADIYYEARWTDTININSLNLSREQQSEVLNENSTVRIKDTNIILPWTPQLLIANAIGQVVELDKWLTVKKNIEGNYAALSPPVVNLNLCEHRRLRGVFWEKLELNHFPADVQDLTISLTTNHHFEHCILAADDNFRSTINREAFFDQQEWKLYEHVATEMKQTEEEYSFEDENSGLKQEKHPVLKITCRAARRPGYYYWNGFCLIFLITVCSFCIFSIPPDLPQSRLQITCTLLLTSVTFRWVVNRSLPTISYLTTLDKYAIVSIILLVLLCVWHSIIASVVFFNPETAAAKGIGPTNIYVNLDRYVFICTFVTYIILHISLIIWLIFVPYKRRREMEYLDRQYADKKHIQLETTRGRYKSMQIQPQDPLFDGHLPAVKSPIRSVKQHDVVFIIPNASTFLPIKEETNDMALETFNTNELNEHDDVFYEQTNERKK